LSNGNEESELVAVRAFSRIASLAAAAYGLNFFTEVFHVES